MDVRSAAPVDPAGLEAILAPDAPGRMLPAEAYTSEAVLAWERQHLFADSWVCAGRSADLADAGDRRALRVGDDSVVLVRGDDGVLRGFYNVCRHRGHQLQPEDTTIRRNAIHCPYHAWTYGLDGTLMFTPRYDEPPGFDPADHPLVAGAHRGVARLGVRQRVGRRTAARRAPRRPVRRDRQVGPGAPGRRSQPQLRDGRQLEAPGGELPGVLPLPGHPPGAVRGQPAQQRRQLRRARRPVDRRLDGPRRRRGDDVPGRPDRRGDAARPRRHLAAPGALHRRPAQPARSASTPTT